MRRPIEFVIVWSLLFLGVFIGFPLGLNTINHILCALGWALFALGSFVHYLSHKAHPKAHEDTKAIDYIATQGVYSWVRHPGYLGLMLMFFGVAIAFGSIPALIIALLLTIHHYLLAVKEERSMLEKFGDSYAKYMEKVPDRLLPLRKFFRRRR
ncbi:MAG: hypothetical protein DRN15_03825 [Thermoprotei archaeon]|nr:MAG: hypothetical protein DRM97_05570 [Thermoprotei archaeon]RLF24254.1 MAG: hypothetical protein DRN15_03825 [Thermoprotei archaeon]